jgi:hypothetical protein
MAKPAFKLEPRYVVVKGSDAEKYLNTADCQALSVIMRKISVGRAHDGKSELGVIVIESDWPEFGPTVKLLEARVNGDAADRAD